MTAVTFELPLGTASGGNAVLSVDGRYRYALMRRWGDGEPVAFVMLNPSTADASTDDPTIRRCVGFAKRWGYGQLLVVNLFAWRATDPKALSAADDPVGGENDGYLSAVACQSARVVAAWGAWLPPWPRDRAKRVVSLLREQGVDLYHLGLTAAGQPRHPLYLPKSTTPAPWMSP